MMRTCNSICFPPPYASLWGTGQKMKNHENNYFLCRDFVWYISQMKHGRITKLFNFVLHRTFLVISCYILRFLVIGSSSSWWRYLIIQSKWPVFTSFFLKRGQEAGWLITSFTTFEAFSNIRIVSNDEKVAKLLYWPSSISSHCVWRSGLVLWVLAFDIINKTLLAFALTQGFSTCD